MSSVTSISQPLSSSTAGYGTHNEFNVEDFNSFNNPLTLKLYIIYRNCVTLLLIAINQILSSSAFVVDT